MTISVRCTCGAKINAKDKLAGKKVACPKCKQPLLITTATASTENPLATASTKNPPATDGVLDNGLEPLAGNDQDAGLGLAAIGETDPLGDPLDLGDLPGAELGAFDTGAASSLGPSMKLPSPTASQAPSPAETAEKKRAPAEDKRMILIAAIGGVGAFTMVLVVGGGIALLLLSGSSEVAEKPPAENSTRSSADVSSGGNAATSQVKIRDDNGLKMKLCLCPPGKFPYGGKGSEAEITHEFWLGQTEVTQSQWKLIMQTPSTEQKTGNDRDNYPVSFVSWHDAMEFCQRMTEVERQQGRIDRELEYRLPTEAEWFYASQAPRISAATGERLKTREFAWYSITSGGAVHEVAELPANVWGLHDIVGNVSEWTLDRFATSAQAKQAVTGGQNPLKWYDVEEGAPQWNHARGANYSTGIALLIFRKAVSSTLKADNHGFRVALARPTQQTAR